MTLDENKKYELIKIRIQQASDTASDAELLLSFNKIPAAVNRIYYAVFYCLLAFAIDRNFKTSKHLQLIGWFNKTFISTKLIDSNFGRIIRNCYEYRKSADYDAFVVIEPADVQQLFDEMQSFLKMVRDYFSE